MNKNFLALTRPFIDTTGDHQHFVRFISETDSTLRLVLPRDHPANPQDGPIAALYTCPPGGGPLQQLDENDLTLPPVPVSDRLHPGDPDPMRVLTREDLLEAVQHAYNNAMEDLPPEMPPGAGLTSQPNN